MSQDTKIRNFVTVKCPHCGHTNRFLQDLVTYLPDNRFFSRCDPEQGGCDELLAYQAVIEIKTIFVWHLPDDEEVQP